MRSNMAKLFMAIVIVGSSILFSGCNPLERKNKAGLQVITNDIAVSIFIDDQFLGKSPFLTKDLKPGEYIVKLEPEDTSYTAYETTLNLRKGMLSVVTWKPGPTLAESGGVIYELEKLPNKNQTAISVLSIPDGGIISIDQKEKKFAPYEEEGIEEGSHDFEISLPSYETQNHTINVVKGHRLNILVKLAKENLLDQEEVAEPKVKEEVKEISPPPSPVINRKTTEATEAGEVKGTSIPAATPSQTSQPLRQPASNISLDGGKVLIKKTNFFVDGKEVLKVRDASTSAGKTIGYVESGKEYPYLEEQTQNWIKLSIGNKSGWVSSLYAEIQK